MIARITTVAALLGIWAGAADADDLCTATRGVNFDEAFRDAVRGAGQVLSGNGQPESQSAP
jgi:hypothetical protein